MLAEFYKVNMHLIIILDFVKNNTVAWAVQVFICMKHKILPLRKLLSLEWRSSLSLLTRVKMQCSPTWRSLMATGLLSAITQTWRRSWTRSSRCKNWPWPWPWPWRAQLYAYVYIQVEGIPTLVVVTKEGKLLTDQGDEQVLNRKICFYYLHLHKDIFPDIFVPRWKHWMLFQVTSLKPAEAVGAWKQMADKS